MPKRPSRSIKLSNRDIHKLYAARQFLGSTILKKVGLRIPFDVYFQDPLVAEENPDFGFDSECLVDWEPGLADGPTSARFAVVDYNADADMMAPPAEWDPKSMKFIHEDKVLDQTRCKSLQFHQVNVWAILQRALRFFEGPNGLGRRVPWGFEGNRLLVVPHAGFGKNAYYDRRSKSLQFYYFEKELGHVFTCLSTDIVHHEFGHAVLDGIRPLFNESASVETAAFHEFIGDLTAILIILRNNSFRNQLVKETQGDLSGPTRLDRIAEEFGKEVKDRPYLRSANNEVTMADMAGSNNPHAMSQVMTGAMFDILKKLSVHYLEHRNRTAGQAFWDCIQRMQRTAIQPLDFLPPVDVTFKDYAHAVLRAEEISNPRDPYGYRGMMLESFVNRGILSAADAEELLEDGYLHDRLQLDIFHSVDQIGASKANAYRFLDDNRNKLGLPGNRDIQVTDLYFADKFTRQARRLPRQLILEYMWREDIPLNSERFGRFSGNSASMLCGGTLVFDDNGTVLWWAKKDDSKTQKNRFLKSIEERIESGQIGQVFGGEKGLLGTRMAPFSERLVDGSLRIEMTPHLGLDDACNEIHGERKWQPSS